MTRRLVLVKLLVMSTSSDILGNGLVNTAFTPMFVLAVVDTGAYNAEAAREVRASNGRGGSIPQTVLADGALRLVLAVRRAPRAAVPTA